MKLRMIHTVVRMNDIFYFVCVFVLVFIQYDTVGHIMSTIFNTDLFHTARRHTGESSGRRRRRRRQPHLPS